MAMLSLIRKANLSPSQRNVRRHLVARSLPTAKSRRAAAAVEFALIAPLMMAFTFGLVEVGHLMMIKSQAIQATREGARLAVLPNAQSVQVVNRVKESLELLAVTNANVQLEPAVLTTAVPGSLVTVRVVIDPASVSWVPGFLSNAVPDLVAETTMRREATN